MADLKGNAIFNTGPYKVDGVQHIAEWVNTEKRPIRIRKSIVWIGLDFDAKADLYAQLFRKSDGAVINPFCWDRYANPNAPHQHMNDFKGDDFMRLGTKDSILLYYYAASASVDSECNAHMAAWIWYSK